MGLGSGVRVRLRVRVRVLGSPAASACRAAGRCLRCPRGRAAARGRSAAPAARSSAAARPPRPPRSCQSPTCAGRSPRRSHAGFAPDGVRRRREGWAGGVGGGPCCAQSGRSRQAHLEPERERPRRVRGASRAIPGTAPWRLDVRDQINQQLRVEELHVVVEQPHPRDVPSQSRPHLLLHLQGGAPDSKLDLMTAGLHRHLDHLPLSARGTVPMLPALQHRVRAPLLHPQPLTPVSRPPREAEILPEPP